MSIMDIQTRIRDKIGLDVKLTPYKLCDFKPCYGHLFDDYINGYDWWGLCDLDVIWGDLRRYCCSDEILNNYDQAFGRGHLSLYKHPKMDLAYTLPSSSYSDYKAILQSSFNFAFDEWHGLISTISQNGYKQYFSEVVADIDFTKYRLTLSNCQNYKYQTFLYDNGRIFQIWYDENSSEICTKQFAYIHLQKRVFSLDKDNLGEKFYITPKGFVKWYEIKEKFEFNNLNPKYNLRFSLRYVKYRIRNGIRRVKSRNQINDSNLKKMLV